MEIHALLDGSSVPLLWTIPISQASACTPRTQLLNLSPTQALHLAEGLAVFHFPFPQHAVNIACPVFRRELREKWLLWGKSFVVGYKMK